MAHIQMFEKLVQAHAQMTVKEPDIKAVFGNDDIISFE
jgi:hypothetical protein